MKRVLCILSNMNAGGAETFLMKVYRCLDRTKYQMDFCVTAENNIYADEIEKMGGKLYIIPAKSKHPVQSFMAIRNLVRDERYISVMRVNEHALSVIDLLAAKCGGAEKLIMRSSNASSGGKLSVLLHKIFRFLPENIPTVKIAPSRLAAEYTFGKKNLANGAVKILKNGLDIEKFSYSEECREKIRKEFSIEDKFVIGHVGRFDKQKNHEFLLEIFFDFQKQQKNAVLLMVGIGVLQDSIQSKAIELGIEDKCIFAGQRKDVNELLSAMDVFLFPSLYEGMPNTVIEAQTAGLHCLISDSITREANVTGLVTYIALSRTCNEWSDMLLEISKQNSNRIMTANIMKQQGYEIKDVAKEFIDLVY